VKVIRLILILFATETIALILLGAIILTLTAAWQFLTGGAL